jgi:hypothetical protein
VTWRADLEMIPLASPRALTTEERALLDFLLAGPLGDDRLRAQAATARVVAQCSCGCPSVGLAVNRSLQESAQEHDWLEIAAHQRTSITDRIETALHVVDGRLERLEVWAGRYGLRPTIDLTRLEYRHISAG